MDQEFRPLTLGCDDSSDSLSRSSHLQSSSASSEGLSQHPLDSPESTAVHLGQRSSSADPEAEASPSQGSFDPQDIRARYPLEGADSLPDSHHASDETRDEVTSLRQFEIEAEVGDESAASLSQYPIDAKLSLVQHPIEGLSGDLPESDGLDDRTGSSVSQYPIGSLDSLTQYPIGGHDSLLPLEPVTPLTQNPLTSLSQHQIEASGTFSDSLTPSGVSQHPIEESCQDSLTCSTRETPIEALNQGDGHVAASATHPRDKFTTLVQDFTDLDTMESSSPLNVEGNGYRLEGVDGADGGGESSDGMAMYATRPGTVIERNHDGGAGASGEVEDAGGHHHGYLAHEVQLPGFRDFSGSPYPSVRDQEVSQNPPAFDHSIKFMHETRLSNIGCDTLLDVGRSPVGSSTPFTLREKDLVAPPDSADHGRPDSGHPTSPGSTELGPGTSRTDDRDTSKDLDPPPANEDEDTQLTIDGTFSTNKTLLAIDDEVGSETVEQDQTLHSPQPPVDPTEGRESSQTAAELAGSIAMSDGAAGSTVSTLGRSGSYSDQVAAILAELPVENDAENEVQDVLEQVALPGGHGDMETDSEAEEIERIAGEYRAVLRDHLSAISDTGSSSVASSRDINRSDLRDMSFPGDDDDEPSQHPPVLQDHEICITQEYRPDKGASQAAAVKRTARSRISSSGSDTVDSLDRDVKKILAKYGKSLSDSEDERSSQASSRRSPLGSVSDGDDTAIKSRVHKLLYGKVAADHSQKTLDRSSSNVPTYLYDDPSQSMSLPIDLQDSAQAEDGRASQKQQQQQQSQEKAAEAGQGKGNSTSAAKAPVKAHIADPGYSSDELSSRVRDLLTTTAHLKDGRAETRVDREDTAAALSSKRSCSSSRASSVDLNTVEKDLNELEVDLATLKRSEGQRSRRSSAGSQRSSHGSYVSDQLADHGKNATMTSALWDHAADIGGSTDGRFVSTHELTPMRHAAGVDASHSKPTGWGAHALLTSGVVPLDVALDIVHGSDYSHHRPSWGRPDRGIQQTTAGYGSLGRYPEVSGADREVERFHHQYKGRTSLVTGQSASSATKDTSDRSLTEQVQDIMERDSPTRQAYEYLQEAADSRKSLESRAVDHNFTKFTPAQGIGTPDSLQLSMTDPALQSATSPGLSFNVSPIAHAPFRAFGNVQSLFSSQLDKVSTARFDTSVELRTPFRERIVENRGQVEDPDSITIERWSDGHHAVYEGKLSAGGRSSSRTSEMCEVIDDQVSPWESHRTRSRDKDSAYRSVSPTEARLFSSLRDSSSSPDFGGSDPYSLAERGPAPVAYSLASDVARPRSQTDPLVISSGSDSSHGDSQRKKTPSPHLRPYRPSGSSELYYVESGAEDTTSVAVSDATVESTHPGSDDAHGPNFPPQVLGSRREAPVVAPGIYPKQPAPERDLGLSTIQEHPSLNDSRDNDGSYGSRQSKSDSSDKSKRSVESLKQTEHWLTNIFHKVAAVDGGDDSDGRKDSARSGVSEEERLQDEVQPHHAIGGLGRPVHDLTPGPSTQAPHRSLPPPQRDSRSSPADKSRGENVSGTSRESRDIREYRDKRVSDGATDGGNMVADVHSEEASPFNPRVGYAPGSGSLRDSMSSYTRQRYTASSPSRALSLIYSHPNDSYCGDSEPQSSASSPQLSHVHGSPQVTQPTEIAASRGLSPDQPNTSDSLLRNQTVDQILAKYKEASDFGTPKKSDHTRHSPPFHGSPGLSTRHPSANSTQELVSADPLGERSEYDSLVRAPAPRVSPAAPLADSTEAPRSLPGTGAAGIRTEPGKVLQPASLGVDTFLPLVPDETEEGHVINNDVEEGRTWGRYQRMAGREEASQDAFSEKLRREASQDAFSEKLQREASQDALSEKLRREASQDAFSEKLRREASQDAFSEKLRREASQDAFSEKLQREATRDALSEKLRREASQDALSEKLRREASQDALSEKLRREASQDALSEKLRREKYLLQEESHLGGPGGGRGGPALDSPLKSSPEHSRNSETTGGGHSIGTMSSDQSSYKESSNTTAGVSPVGSPLYELGADGNDRRVQYQQGGVTDYCPDGVAKYLVPGVPDSHSAAVSDYSPYGVGDYRPIGMSDYNHSAVTDYHADRVSDYPSAAVSGQREERPTGGSSKQPSSEKERRLNERILALMRTMSPGVDLPPDINQMWQRFSDSRERTRSLDSSSASSPGHQADVHRAGTEPQGDQHVTDDTRQKLVGVGDHRHPGGRGGQSGGPRERIPSANKAAVLDHSWKTSEPRPRRQTRQELPRGSLEPASVMPLRDDAVDVMKERLPRGEGHGHGSITHDRGKQRDSAVAAAAAAAADAGKGGHTSGPAHPLTDVKDQMRNQGKLATEQETGGKSRRGTEKVSDQGEGGTTENRGSQPSGGGADRGAVSTGDATHQHSGGATGAGASSGGGSNGRRPAKRGSGKDEDADDGEMPRKMAWIIAEETLQSVPEDSTLESISSDMTPSSSSYESDGKLIMRTTKRHLPDDPKLLRLQHKISKQKEKYRREHVRELKRRERIAVLQRMLAEQGLRYEKAAKKDSSRRSEGVPKKSERSGRMTTASEGLSRPLPGNATGALLQPQPHDYSSSDWTMTGSDLSLSSTLTQDSMMSETPLSLQESDDNRGAKGSRRSVDQPPVDRLCSCKVVDRRQMSPPRRRPSPQRKPFSEDAAQPKNLKLQEVTYGHQGQPTGTHARVVNPAGETQKPSRRSAPTQTGSPTRRRSPDKTLKKKSKNNANEKAKNSPSTTASSREYANDKQFADLGSRIQGRTRAPEDFGQTYPSPITTSPPTVRRQYHDVPMVSHGVQTTPAERTGTGQRSNLGQDQHATDLGQENRAFVSVPLSPSRKPRAAKGRRSRPPGPFSPERSQTDVPRKRSAKEKNIVKAAQSGLAWFVPWKTTEAERRPLSERQVNSLVIEPRQVSAERSEFRRSEVTHPHYTSRKLADMGYEKPQEKVTLQDAFMRHMQGFVSVSRQRERCVALRGEERRMEALLQEERDKLFGLQRKTGLVQDPHPLSEQLFQPKIRKITRKEMKEMTQKAYQKLPEVVERKKEQKTQAFYRENRLRAKLYQQKIQNKVLNKGMAWVN